LEKRVRNIPYAGPTSGMLEHAWMDYLDPKSAGWARNTADNKAVFAQLDGIQVTESESHPGWDSSFKKNFSGDRGGPFYSQKIYSVLGNTSPVVLFKGESTEPTESWPSGHLYDQYYYSGPYLPCEPNLLSFPNTFRSLDRELDALGTKAISQCSPSNPSVDLGVAIGELIHDGIPSLIGSTLRKWRDLGGSDRKKAISHEHLNYEFGWKPLISDIRKLCSAIISANSILSNYSSNSGHLVRRRYDFPPTDDHASTVVLQNVSPWCNPSTNRLLVPGYVGKGQVFFTHRVQKRQWFSGAFTYYVPPSDTMRNDMARQVIQARKLLGLSLTPDVLWNLAPWSWAVDWFGNVGDVLSNWTDWAIDNQVLAYGYMMEHSIRSYNYIFSGPTGWYPLDQRPTDVTTFCETKIRRQATPYGFGVSWDDLSPRQLAIAASLGITRSK